jgi:hypothetical protein
MIGTALAGARREPRPIEWAEPLEGPPLRRSIFDRFGLWALVAVVLVVIAYAYPLWHHLRMTRFGSPPFVPF